MANVDQLSDEAHRASKLALATHGLDEHKAAADAHKAAFMAAQANSRPSLAQHHLQAAAQHDRYADPTTKEGKAASAHRLSIKARQTGKPEDHDAAEQAHKDAALEHRTNGDFRGAERHSAMANDHALTAHRLRNPRGVG
jgi:hypothetical protein